MESLYFLLPLFFILLLIVPLNFKIKLVFNLFENNVLISFFIWRIKISTLKITLKNNNIIIITKKKKKEVQFSLSIKQIYFVETLIDNLKNKIQAKKINVNSKIGLIDSAQTAMMCGSFISMVKIIFCYIKNKKPTCSMDNLTMPCFNKKIFIICTYLSCSITAFDLLYSVIISLFSLRRKVYEKSRRKSKLS